MSAVPPPLCSIVIPAYNEAGTIGEVLRRVCALGLDAELIVVDDGSRDGTAEAAREATRGLPRVRVQANPRNRGKGFALRTGFALAAGEVVAVQDADLELWPEDLPRLLAPFADPAVEAVYGSRFLEGGARCRRRTRLANAFLSGMTSALYGARVTDMETCYKLVRRRVLARLELVSERFEIEPEITAKLLRAGVRIRELPIRYAARTHAEGKTIGWRDGVDAMLSLVRWRVTPRARFLRGEAGPRA